jgi:hypothetical protein
MSNVDPPELPSLSDLPYDIHYDIFQHLLKDQVTSVCLGLTSRYFYSLHCKFHKSPIWLRESVFAEMTGQLVPLHQLLRKWMGRHLRFTYYEVDKFVTLKRWHELERYGREEQRWSDGWESC